MSFLSLIIENMKSDQVLIFAHLKIKVQFPIAKKNFPRMAL